MARTIIDLQYCQVFLPEPVTRLNGQLDWYSFEYPTHECVDRPELPCPACEAARISVRAA
jgi:hypothetical protein